MNYKEKLAAVILQEFKAEDVKDFQRLLFLLCNKHLKNNVYFDFVRVADGFHSFEAENIYQRLSKKNIAEVGKRYLKEFSFEEKIAVQDLHLNQNHIIEAAVVEKIKSDTEKVFYTIGYEGLSLDQYINKLLGHDIKLLCDVRKNAYSQKFGFPRPELQTALGKTGISYQHMPEFGIVSEKRRELRNDYDYTQLFDEYENSVLKDNLSQLASFKELLNQYGKIAITCFEADAKHCHRGRMAKILKSSPTFKYPIVNL